MAKQTKGYVIDMERFKKTYKKETGKTLTVYDIAELLGISYQTVLTLDKKPIKSLSHLKKLSELSRLNINKLIKAL